MSKLTRAQINKAINDLIKGEFPGIPIQSRDISKGFDRPSFYVDLETNRMDTSQFNLERDMTCRILYFPSDRHEYKEEAYQVQDKLETLFGLNFEVVYNNILTLAPASVQAGQTVVINGVTFTAHASETTPAKREFSINGTDAAAAAALAGLINDATYGVFGVDATVESNIITLTAAFRLIFAVPGTVTAATVKQESRIITINDADTDIVDKVLHYNFNFVYLEDVAAEETGELMEELEYNA